MTKILQRDWESIYKHPIYYLETFVDQERFKGTCYFAANWLYLGQTTGRGKNDHTRKANRSLKAVLGYPDPGFPQTSLRGPQVKEKVQSIELDQEQINALLQRASKNELEERDLDIIKTLVQAIQRLHQAVDDKAASIKRLLRTIFGVSTEKKKAIQHRKNALFYRTLHGARIGDLFMSFIHTCQLNKENSFD